MVNISPQHRDYQYLQQYDLLPCRLLFTRPKPPQCQWHDKYTRDYHIAEWAFYPCRLKLRLLVTYGRFVTPTFMMPERHGIAKF